MVDSVSSAAFVLTALELMFKEGMRCRLLCFDATVLTDADSVSIMSPVEHATVAKIKAAIESTLKSFIP